VNDPPGFLFGIYDGHGGASCGIVAANRLQHYVAAALLNDDQLKSHLERLKAVGRWSA
jgi:serine/threonine protein phosphatase PrpC